MSWKPWLTLILAVLAFMLTLFGFVTLISLVKFFFEWLWAYGSVGSLL